VSDSDQYLRTRMPKGEGLSPRVGVLLQKDEKDRLKAAARKDGRSESSMARLLILRGLDQIEHAA
jgi:hypothetical protein